MSKLSDHIDETIHEVLRECSKDLELNLCDNKSIVALAVGMNDYLRQNYALNAARRAASTVEGAEAYGAELTTLQVKTAHDLAERTGLSEHKLLSTLGTLVMAGSRYQPNVNELKEQLVGKLAIGREK